MGARGLYEMGRNVLGMREEQSRSGGALQIMKWAVALTFLCESVQGKLALWKRSAEVDTSSERHTAATIGGTTDQLSCWQAATKAAPKPRQLARLMPPLSALWICRSAMLLAKW